MNVNSSERTCPRCGSTRQALITYGLVHTSRLRTRLEAGSVVLGGCSITGEDPEWYCLDCRGKWGISEQSRRILEWAESEGSREPPLPLWGRIGFRFLAVLLYV